MASRPTPRPLRAIQWAPSGNPLEGVPSEICRFLATADGRTFGYGYGDGWSMIFGSQRGDISLNAGEWLIANDDGSYEVANAKPQALESP